MEKILVAIIKALNVIHTENLVIMATMTGKETDDPCFDVMNKAFSEAISEIVKKDNK